MDDSIIPTIPKYLLAKNKAKPRNKRRMQDSLVMPAKKETRAQRRHTKEEHDKMVLAAVKNGADTFAKIRKETDHGFETNEIRNSIGRNIKARRITKRGRRYS